MENDMSGMRKATPEEMEKLRKRLTDLQYIGIAAVDESGDSAIIPAGSPTERAIVDEESKNWPKD